MIVAVCLCTTSALNQLTMAGRLFKDSTEDTRVLHLVYGTTQVTTEDHSHGKDGPVWPAYSNLPLSHDLTVAGLLRYKEATAALRKRIVDNNRILRDRGALGPREHEALSDEQARLQVRSFSALSPARASVSDLHLSA